MYSIFTEFWNQENKKDIAEKNPGRFWRVDMKKVLKKRGTFSGAPFLSFNLP